jgi:hypothetical protein
VIATMTARLALIGAVVFFAAIAQDRRQDQDSTTRSVQGIVTDQSGKPVANAAVLLKDTKSLQIRSFRTAGDGAYHFAGLSQNVEYQLKADAGGSTSGWKTLSVFNSKKVATIDLKLK